MNINYKIEQLEKLRQQLWDELRMFEDCYLTAIEKGIGAEVQLLERHINSARSRWATTNRIIKFLKDEIKAEEL